MTPGSSAAAPWRKLGGVSGSIARLVELPTLGVGASLSFGVEPDPVALAGRPGGPAFIEYAGAVDAGGLEPTLSQLKRQKVPLLYHPSCLNLCGPWPNPASWLTAVDQHCRRVGSPWLAQDVAVCFVGDDPGYSIQLGYFVPPILTEASLAQASERVREVQARVATPLLLEPAPVTYVAGDMTIFDWLGQLARETDAGLLLDAGHVVSHQLALGREDLTSGLDALPLERVIEVHVAGGVIQERGGRRYYLDAHDLPVLPETWHVFHWLLGHCPNLRAVCFECEGQVAHAVMPVLERTRLRVTQGAASDELRRAVEQELAA